MRRPDATAATEKRSIMHKAKDIQIVFKKSGKTLWNMYIRGLTKFWDRSDLWSKVSLVFEDFMFKISDSED